MTRQNITRVTALVALLVGAFLVLIVFYYRIFDVSADEEQALLAAIAQAERGQVVSWDELRQQLRRGA